VPDRRARVLAGLLVLLFAVATAPTADAASQPWFPTHLTSLGSSRQVVVVTSSSWSTSHATLRTFEKGNDGRWRAKLGATSARIGGRGFRTAALRRQGTYKTPAGTFRLTRAFGSARDPGTAMAYRRFDSNDWWPYDPRSPRTYNVYQTHRVAAATWRRSWAEHLSSYGGQYRFAVVLDFNLPSGLYRSGGQRLARHPADTRKGGGIFLHVNGPGGTAGCVSLPAADMVAVLRWLDPAKNPRIVMGPQSVIGRM
jgi:L,D-peptidoglycan transpeptidase YkuD (ErfK/YbiS/YcfS/YnhG family)